MPHPPVHSPTLLCTVDVVLLTLAADGLQVALRVRDHAPHAGALALPGGFVHREDDRSTRDAAARVLREKTGLHSPYLEQLATFSGPDRDPRGWSVSVVYYALVPPPAPQAMPAAPLAWHPVDRLPALPFDHAEIVRQALARVRSKSQYSSLPVHLCGERFTLPQLKAVYEAVLGERVNQVSFRRRMDELGMLEPVVGEMVGGAHRPAQVWRVKAAFRGELSLSERVLAGRE